MTPITIDGVKYLHIKEAAQTAGLAADYIGRLCRRGVVRGIKRDRVWFVNDQSLKNFLIHQAYEKARASQLLSHDRRGAYRRARSLARSEDMISANASPVLLRPHIIGRFRQAIAREAHTVAQIVGGGAPYAISPALDFLHRLSAAVLAIAVVTGTTALFSADFRESVAVMLPQTAAAASAVDPKLERAFHDLLRDLATHHL